MSQSSRGFSGFFHTLTLAGIIFITLVIGAIASGSNDIAAMGPAAPSPAPHEPPEPDVERGLVINASTLPNAEARETGHQGEQVSNLQFENAFPASTVQGTSDSFVVLPSGSPILSQAVSVDDWQSYRDNYWNFELMYPPEWELQNLPWRDFGVRLNSPELIVDELGRPIKGGYLSISASQITVDIWNDYLQNHVMDSTRVQSDNMPAGELETVETYGVENGNRIIERVWFSPTSKSLHIFRFVEAGLSEQHTITAKSILNSISIVGNAEKYPAPDYESLGIDLSSFIVSIKHAFQAGEGKIMADQYAGSHTGGDENALDLCEGSGCAQGIIGQFVIAPANMKLIASRDNNGIPNKDFPSDPLDFHFFELANDGVQRLCMSFGHFQIRLPGLTEGKSVHQGALIGTLTEYRGYSNAEHIHMGLYTVASTLPSCLHTPRTALSFTGNLELDGNDYNPNQPWNGRGVTSTNYAFCANPYDTLLQQSEGHWTTDTDPGSCFGKETTPPSASGFSASVTQGRTAEITTSGVQDNSGGSGVKEVRFSAKWGGNWYGIGTDSSAPYTLSWDMCSNNVPNGDVELGMEIWDNAGNQWVWSEYHVNPHVTKQNNCDTLPGDKVRIYEHPNLTSIMHAWQDAGRFNVPDNANEKASSIWIENGWSVRVHDNPNQQGDNKCFTGSVLNLSDVGFDNRISSIEIFHQADCPQPPKPDLQPFTPSGWQYPVVPNSSAQPTQATTTLYAGGYPGRDVMTFFDWAFTNSGSGTANGDFHVEVRIDGNWFIRYPFSNVGPGGGKIWENWLHPVFTPGQHVIKIVVDPDNRIAESNESNNEWQHTFTWQPISGWYAEYYSNKSLTWPPAVVRDDPEINFSWSGSPAPNIPADGFSVRWARTDNFNAGTYRFSGYQDDGARVKIDGTTYYEEWTHPTVRSFTFDQALPAGQHTVMFDMYEHNGGAQAELSWELLAPTGPGVPSLDRPPDGIVFDGGVINLIWFTSHDAKHYYAILSGGPDVNRNSGWVSDTIWTAGLLPGGSYQWKVKARNLNGVESSYSQSRSFSVKYGSPTNLTATAASSTQIDLSWNASADAPGNIDGYRIYRNGSAIATVSGATTTFANTGLSCETGYTYIVRAYKGSVESDASNNASTATTSCSLSAPDVNPIYNPDGDGTFRILWSAFPGAIRYIAEQRHDNGAWELSYSGDGEWYEVEDYSVGEWCFRVQAMTTTATSPWSTIVCTQVSGSAEPPNTPILSAIGNPSQANAYWVSWSSVNGATTYELQEGYSSGTFKHIFSGSDTYKYILGQSEGQWCYRVRAKNGTGTSNWSQIQCTTVVLNNGAYKSLIPLIID